MKRKEAAAIIKPSEKKISVPAGIIATNGKTNSNGKVVPTLG
jgi:hypothetical protein